MRACLCMCACYVCVCVCVCARARARVYIYIKDLLPGLHLASGAVRALKRSREI